MIRFFHVADIHFGVENYGRVDPATGIHSRLLDFKLSLDTCIAHAIAEKIDFFIFSGDAYKTAYPTPTQQRLLMQSFFMLYKAGIPVIIIVGNHDHPLSFGKAHALDVFKELPIDGFHVFAKPELMTLTTKNGPIQIVGIPWPTRHNVITNEEHRIKKSNEITSYLSEQVSAFIEHIASVIDPTIPAILGGHLTVSSGIFSGSEKCAVFGSDPIFLPSQLALPGFDYVALGHLHRHQDLNEQGYPPVVYAGSIDRVDFGERKEVKGYCDVTIDTTVTASSEHERPRRTSYQFVPLTTRPFIQIELELKAGSTHTEQIIDAINEHPIDGAIVKIIYHVPRGIQDRVDLTTVGRALASAMYVVGIFPQRTQEKRTQRAPINVGMDFATLINTYLATKPELASSKDRLLQKAHALLHDVENQNQEQS